LTVLQPCNRPLSRGRSARKSNAYADFKAAGGEILIPSAEEKPAFKTAVAPVFNRFKANVKRSPEVPDAFIAKAEADSAAERAADLN